jgi:putative hydrolase of the HAD superfamily
MILPSGIKAIIFDLYGTLLLYNDIKKANLDWVGSFYHYLNNKNDVTMEVLSPFCKWILTGTVAKDNELGLTTYETKIKDGLFSIGIELPLEEIKELADFSVSTWQKHISLAKDAKYVLSELGKKYQLGLITNFDHSKHINRVLNENHLTEYFDQIIISDEVEITKPDPEIFNITLLRMHLKNIEAVFVGDSMKDDISGALKAGIHPVFITQEEYNVNHEFETAINADRLLLENKHKIKYINSLAGLLE